MHVLQHKCLITHYCGANVSSWIHDNFTLRCLQCLEYCGMPPNDRETNETAVARQRPATRWKVMFSA